jgi:hypothetical protein
MAHPPLVHVKTCNRCGRTGSHAFRGTPDGLHECTTVTACRARTRRNAGLRGEGRGRLPKQAGLNGAPPGVAYVIGQADAPRALVEETLRDATPLAVAVGEPNRATLTALGSRNVKLIAIDARCLARIGFRNEFSLRRRQPRLSSVPVFLYGDDATLAPMAPQFPDARLIGFANGPREAIRRLRREVRVPEAAVRARV